MVSESIIKIEHYIEDSSGVISPQYFSKYNELFAQMYEAEKEQVVTVFFPHRQGRGLLEMGLEIFNENKIGAAGKNNGLLLLVATEEKKIRIMVGKGLEWIYTNQICKHIIEDELRPLLNQGKFEALLEKWYTIAAGKETYIAHTKKYKSSHYNGNTGYQPNTPEGELFLMLVLGNIFMACGLFAGNLIWFFHMFTIAGLTTIGSSIHNFHNKKNTTTLPYFIIALVIAFCFIFEIIPFIVLGGYFLLCCILSPLKGNPFLYLYKIILFLLAVFSFWIGINLENCNYTPKNTICKIQETISKKVKLSNNSDSDTNYSSWSSSSSSSDFSGGGGSSNGAGWGD